MDLLYIDQALLVLNKPAGLPVLPDGWDKDAPYLVKMLEGTYGRIWIVHRLDKTTSGVMVFARNVETHRALSVQFEKHEARKIYHAIAIGNPKWDEKIARHPLRVNVGHKHRTMVDDKNGKPSETRFKVLKRYPAHALLEAELTTGRTHQIRVHAYALGHPLLGDVLYSAPKTDLIARPALHAYTLSFTHPQSAADFPQNAADFPQSAADSPQINERLIFTAPYPPDFEEAMRRTSQLGQIQ